MGGKRNDGNVLGCLILFETSRRFPAVDHRKIEVHQNEVRLLGCRYRAPGFPVYGAEHFKSLQQLKAHFKHVDIVVVIFDVKNSGHDVASDTLCDLRFSATTRRTVSTSCAGVKESFANMSSTPELRRARSAAVRSI